MRRAVVLLVATLVSLTAFALTLGSCSLSGGSGDAGARADERARTLEQARSAFAGAAEALRARDRTAFLRLADDASPASDKARDALAIVYDTLSPLPWRTFELAVTPLDKRSGLYRVVGSGQLGAAGPADRLAVVRYLELSASAGGVAVTADATPESLRRRYLMALHDPVVLRRPGFIVLADRWASGRARTVLTAAARARPRLVALGLDTRPTVVITVFGSVEDVRDALAVKASTPRLVYFSYPALRSDKATWDVYDVGVMGPWLRDPGVSTGAVLTHELAHAYTARWFAHAAHPSSLLLEGIAEAAEGVFVTPALREEVATGDQLWPLPESFAVGDVWDGSDAEAVDLGYEVGGSLVDYVVGRWGAHRLRPFVQAVSAVPATEAGMDAALEESLGVNWDAFYAGWRRHVLSGG